jgi:hypothetical protein
MRALHRSIPLVVVASALLLGGCGQAATEKAEPGPAIVEPIDGSSLSRLTLTDEAAERIGIETAAVTTGSAGRILVPTKTVLYDENGQAWVYTNPEGNVFLRAEITVVGTDGDETVLSAGPPADTRVVTVGVAELWGTELGVGDPE